MSSIDEQGERRPLLSDSRGEGSHGTVERSNANNSQEDVSSQPETPLADEPSTARIALVMSFCWLGTFLAALGE